MDQDLESTSLLEDIKEYSIKELDQLSEMTKQVLAHWKSMLRPDLKEVTRKAIEISIEISENDLQLIANEKKIKIGMKGVKGKGSTPNNG